MHMFLTVQQSLTQEVMSFTFSNIINLNGLVLMDDGRDIKYKFKMINQSTGTLLNLYQENEYFVGPDQAVLCMEIAYSFLRLMNKTTKHIYPGDVLRSAREHFYTITPDQGNLQHEWLFRFKEGLAVRAEITRFYRNFFVFHNNHLISPEEFRDSWSDLDYDPERLVPRNHVEESGIVNYILEGIKSSTAVTLTSGWWTKDDAETYVEQYFIKNFFTTIYKYVMGVYSLYHYDNSHREMSNTIKKIGTYLKQYTLKGFNKLAEQFPGNEKISKISASLENLKNDLDEFTNSSVLYKIEDQELEEEEINKPFYYKWKRYCV